MGEWPDSPAGRLLRGLERHYGPQVAPPCEGPFEMILWEIVAYLSDDERRGAAFSALENLAGVAPAEILAAPIETLREITRIGGPIAAEERSSRLKSAAQLVMDDFGGDLAAVLRLPPPKAKKRLMRFPMIGEPGAEKILLFSGVLAVLALESNGLRVLVRAGIGEERRSYAATYKSVREATLEQLPAHIPTLKSAHLLLRRHGRELCFHNGPVCGGCPVRVDCCYGRSEPLSGESC